MGPHVLRLSDDRARGEEQRLANNKEAVMKDYKLAAVGFALLLAPL
jgi:hypothetical protein